MLLSTAEDLARFVEELKSETDRGLPLVAAALIDDRLQETLRAFFVEGVGAARLLDEGNAPLGSLSARAEVCLALGLIDDYEYGEIKLIRKVRNRFAHAKHGHSFNDAEVAGLCSSFATELPDDLDYPRGDARFRFTNAALAIVMRLYHRPDWVKLDRRAPKSWVEANAGKWRSIKDDPPPEGQPILVIGKRSATSAPEK